MIDLSIILPIQNQEETIESIFKNLKENLDKLNISYQIVMVENGSTDNSFNALRKIQKKFPCVTLESSEKGYGSAILKGAEKALGEFICYMDSDGQIDPGILQEFWGASKTQKWQIVKAKRAHRESPMRFIISRAYSFLTRLLYRTRLTDINGTPVMCTRKDLIRLNLKSKDSFLGTEIAIKARRLNFKTKEIPITTLHRAGGKSTRNLKTYLEFLKNLIEFQFGKGLNL